MPNYMNHGQSTPDLQAPEQSPDDTTDMCRSYDVFPGETLIGIALGSPRDSPLPSLPLDEPHRYVPPKQKVSRWKSLGGLFAKKGVSRSPSASPSHYSQHPSHRDTTSSFSFQDRNLEANSVAYCCASHADSSQESLRRTPSTSPKTTSTVRNKSLRRKMSFKRGNSERRTVRGAGSPNRNRSHTAPLPRLQSDGPKLHLNGESLLQVEIPSVSEMERYSVMFSDLLQPPTASSLLARKQAHLEELYTGVSVKGVEDLVSISVMSNSVGERPADYLNDELIEPTFSVSPS